MLEPPIDPPVPILDLTYLEDETYDWVDHLFDDFKNSVEIALHNYECKVYNELERRIT